MPDFTRRAAAAVLFTLLAGCASSYRLDTTVQAYSALPSLPPDPTYRLERLPLQAGAADPARIEALAGPALARAGLRRNDAAPRYAVQVAARTRSAIASPALGFGWGWGFGRGLDGPPIQTAANTSYLRDVHVVVRDLASQRVVYEGQADSESFYLNGDEVLAAMFDAALAGFPNPPQGTRHVNVQVAPVRLAAAAPAPAR